MGKQRGALVKHILDQLQALRETVNDLRILDRTEVDSLCGAPGIDEGGRPPPGATTGSAPCRLYRGP